MRQDWSFFCAGCHAQNYAPMRTEWQEKMKAKWKRNAKPTNFGPFKGHLALLPMDGECSSARGLLLLAH
jgi:hypothetical protein